MLLARTLEQNPVCAMGRRKFVMKDRLIALLVGLSCMPVAAKSQEAYIDACAKSLNINEVSGYSDEVVQLALLTFMITSSSDEANFCSKFAGLLSAGFFDGTLNGARAKRDQLEKRLSLSFSHQSASGYLLKYLSAEGAGAFSQCVATVFSKPGVHLKLREADENTASVELIFKTASGEQRTFKVKIFSDGNMPAGIPTTIPPSGVTRHFIITKANPAKNLHIQVDITHDNETVESSSLFIPPAYQSKARWIGSWLPQLNRTQNVEAIETLMVILGLKSR